MAVIREKAIPWAKDQVEYHLQKIKTRVLRRYSGIQPGTDIERTLPPYSRRYGKKRQKRGLSTQPDYRRTGALWNAVQGRIMAVGTDGIKMIIAPYGPYLGQVEEPTKKGGYRVKTPTLIGTTPERLSVQILSASGMTWDAGEKRWKTGGYGRTVKPAGAYWRSPYTDRNGVSVRGSWISLPTIDLQADARSSKSGAYWFALYKRLQIDAMRRASEQAERKRVTRNISAQKVADSLGTRGYGRRQTRGGKRISPFIAFSKSQHKELARGLEAMMATQARDALKP